MTTNTRKGTAPVARGEHTPTPWTSKGPYYPNGTDYPVQYIDGGSDAVAMVCLHHARGEANAALIVEAVNNHTDLLAQRDELREALADTLNMLRAAHMQCGVHHDSNKRVIKARATLEAVKAKAQEAGDAP